MRPPWARWSTAVLPGLAWCVSMMWIGEPGGGTVDWLIATGVALGVMLVVSIAVGLLETRWHAHNARADLARDSE